MGSYHMLSEIHDATNESDTRVYIANFIVIWAKYKMQDGKDNHAIEVSIIRYENQNFRPAKTIAMFTKLMFISMCGF